MDRIKKWFKSGTKESDDNKQEEEQQPKKPEEKEDFTDLYSEFEDEFLDTEPIPVKKKVDPSTMPTPVYRSGLVKTRVIIRYDFRSLFGMDRLIQVGQFIDLHLIRMVHDYSGWVEYPSGEQMLKKEQYPVVMVNVTADGKCMYTGNERGWIRFWTLEGYAIADEWKVKLEGGFRELMDMDVSSDTIVVAVGFEIIYLFNAKTHECIRYYEGNTGVVTCVKFSKNGDYIVSGSRDGTVRLWVTHTGLCEREFSGYTSPIQRVLIDVNDTNTQVISFSDDGSINIWDKDKTHCIQRIQCDEMYESRVCYSVNCDATLIAYTAGITPKVYSMPSMDTYKHECEIKPCSVVEFHPFNPFVLAIVENESVKMYDIDNGSLIDEKMIPSNISKITTMKFTPDASRLIVGTNGDAPLGILDVSGLM